MLACDVWECIQCTFENPDDASACQVCELPRQHAAPFTQPAPRPASLQNRTNTRAVRSKSVRSKSVRSKLVVGKRASRAPANHSWSEPCSICLEECEYKDKAVLECGHTFHSECIESWMKRSFSCPLCRRAAIVLQRRQHGNADDKFVASSCTELHVCNAPNCSNNASGQCRKCKRVYYCCRQHQCEDWKAHKEVCFNAPLSTNELRTHVCNAPDCFNRASGQCKRCKKVYYCSGKHLKRDWKAHKQVCMPDDVEAEWID